MWERQTECVVGGESDDVPGVQLLVDHPPPSGTLLPAGDADGLIPTGEFDSCWILRPRGRISWE